MVIAAWHVSVIAQSPQVVQSFELSQTPPPLDDELDDDDELVVPDVEELDELDEEELEVDDEDELDDEDVESAIVSRS